MNKSFYHIENANIEQCKYQNISPDETVERKELEDFKISVLTNALDKHRTNRQKRMALVNLGGEESEDLSAALQTINENFEKIKISYRELYEQNLQEKSTQIIELHQIRHLKKALRAGELLGFGLQLHLLITQALN